MQPFTTFLQTTQGKLIAGLIALTLCAGPLCLCFGGSFLYLLMTPTSIETAPFEADAPAQDGPAPTALSAEVTATPFDAPTLPPTAPPPTATLPPTATPAEAEAAAPEAPTEAPPATVAPPTATTEIIEETAPATLPDVALQEAQVTNVVDGDTIDVLIDGTEYRIRYILVDTPETKHPQRGVEPFGPEASAFNEQLVGGQTVWLEKDVSETDRYDRLLRYVYLEDGRMVNEELLRAGLATVATFQPDVKYVDRFMAIQQEAQVAGAGLWVGIEAAPPASEPAPAEEAAPVATAPPATAGGPLIITALNKDAEYADIENVSGAAVDLSGWRLLSEKGNQDCPLGGMIEPGQTLRVWALSADTAEGGFNCGFGRNIWNNSERDPAVLFDAGGAEVARME